MTDAEWPVAAVPITVRGESLVLRGDRSLFWTRRRWLIVADVHLGKAESLRRDGVALPDTVMDDDLQRLYRALEATRAERLLVLGDLVHDSHGMTRAVARRVAEWRETLSAEVALVPGNHDRLVVRLPQEWHILELPEVLSDAPFVFSHERLAAEPVVAAPSPDGGPRDGGPRDGGPRDGGPRDGGPRDMTSASLPGAHDETRPGNFNWHGHVHPVRTIRGGSDRVRLPCFGIDARAGVLPAFSTLTGGSEHWGDAGSRAWVIVGGHVVLLPETWRG